MNSALRRIRHPDGLQGKLKGKTMFKKIAGVLVAVAPLSAYAVPPDFTSLTSAIDMSTTSAALLLAAAALIGVYILWKGANMIMGAFKGR